MSSFHGRYALGQKVAAADSAQEPGLLGDERDDVAMRYDSANDIFYVLNSGRVKTKWVKNTSGGALKPGSLVTPDTSGTRMDTDVVQCTTGTAPCGIVDPFLTSDVADDELFLIITKASRIEGLGGATVSKGANLVCGTSGKLVAGTAGNIVALEAVANNVLSDVSCDFSTARPAAAAGVVQTARVETTTANVNAGATLLPAVPGYKYRLHDLSLIAVGGTTAGITGILVRGTQSSSPVSLMDAKIAGLGRSVVLRIGTATNGLVLADGASFAACDANTAITIIKDGGDLTGATAVHALITYELVAA
jgi:hypothetical protein